MQTTFKFTSDNTFKYFAKPMSVTENTNDSVDVISQKCKFRNDIVGLEDEIANIYVSIAYTFTMFTKFKDKPWSMNRARCGRAEEMVKYLFLHTVRKARSKLGKSYEHAGSLEKAKESLLTIEHVDEFLNSDTYNDFETKVSQAYCRNGFDCDAEIIDTYFTNNTEKGLYCDFVNVLHVKTHSDDNIDVQQQKLYYNTTVRDMETIFEQEWTSICNYVGNSTILKSKKLMMADIIKETFKLSARYCRYILGNYKPNGDYKC